MSTSHDERPSHRSIPDDHNPNKQYHFYIFGATDEEKWKMFGVYIGPDSDRLDDSDRIDDSDRLDNSKVWMIQITTAMILTYREIVTKYDRIIVNNMFE